MPPLPHHRIAVIADAHFHDVDGDFGLPNSVSGGHGPALRTLADTARSTRVFNESGAALRHALDDVVARGIRHVVLLGDYSDDGQRATLAGLKRLLDGYVARAGLRFYATVGNHDIFARRGRHRSKRFLAEGGGSRLLSSDPALEPPTLFSEGLYCDGYPQGLMPMADFGFFPKAGDLHWETPFGRDGDPASRLYRTLSPDGTTQREMMDASYLIEPFEGVWLMMIDANVFVPFNGGEETGDFADSTAAGWNAMLKHKPFVIRWMADVAARAKRLGKHLLAFSHYPALDPLDGTLADERALLARSGMAARIPRADVAAAFMDAGVRVHFSGHLHVNDTARVRRGAGFVVNVAVPSLVAFPPAYKTVLIDPAQVTIETIGIGDLPVDPVLSAAYRADGAATGLNLPVLTDAPTHGAFLSQHLANLVSRRHLKREWSADLAALLGTFTLSDLAMLALLRTPVAPGDAVACVADAFSQPGLSRQLDEVLEAEGLDIAALASLPALNFLRDWYRLRIGSDLAEAWVDGQLRFLYEAVGRLYASGRWNDPHCAQAQFALIFRMFKAYTTGLPSRNFAISLADGGIVETP